MSRKSRTSSPSNEIATVAFLVLIINLAFMILVCVDILQENYVGFHVRHKTSFLVFTGSGTCLDVLLTLGIIMQVKIVFLSHYRTMSLAMKRLRSRSFQLCQAFFHQKNEKRCSIVSCCCCPWCSYHW
jgi:hypothetical protein